jgi:hypothetical protein
MLTEYEILEQLVAITDDMTFDSDTVEILMQKTMPPMQITL